MTRSTMLAVQGNFMNFHDFPLSLEIDLEIAVLSKAAIDDPSVFQNSEKINDLICLPENIAHGHRGKGA